MTTTRFDVYKQEPEEIKTDEQKENNATPVKEEEKPTLDLERQQEKIESSTEEVKQSNSEDKDDIQKLRKALEDKDKALNETKSWGHKTNKVLVSAKKKITDSVNKLLEEGNIFEEQKQEILSYFTQTDEDIEEIAEKPVKAAIHPILALREKIDKEFNIFKEYNTTPDIEEKYNAFFAFLPLRSVDKQEEYMEYMREEKPKIVIDYIISKGSELSSLYEGINEQGGIVEYCHHMQAKNDKEAKENRDLKAEVKKLRSELADTTEKVYNGSINSRVVNPMAISAGAINNRFDLYKNK